MPIYRFEIDTDKATQKDVDTLMGVLRLISNDIEDAHIPGVTPKPELQMFRVYEKGPDTNRIKVIKCVRHHAALSLKEAKEAVDSQRWVAFGFGYNLTSEHFYRFKFANEMLELEAGVEFR